MDCMKVIVSGANGAVGQSILRSGRVPAHEHVSFIALVRSERSADELKPLLRSSDAVARVSYADLAALRKAFAEAEAVIHLSGILFESATSTYEQAHIETTRALVETARQTGIKKFVLISATGADERSANGYWRTKGQAESIVRSSGLPFTILRVPLLLGAGTEGAASLRRNAHAPGKVKLVGGGHNFQQPLFVDDLARASITACRADVARDRTLEFVGPSSLRDRELVERAAKHLGRRAQIASIPKGLLRVGLRLRKMTGKRHGFSADALEVVTANTQLDPAEAATALGIELTGIDEMIKSSLEPDKQND
jgi:nucleoside-diphosphate-sugar epimerase